ncbi:hypothetical protein A2198_02615, partial [Candidatus Peribacteria bacterium RIFOXYA1_FULL_56_14]
MTANKPDSTDGCVVITGGTGSFGQAFTRFLLANTDAKIRITSRDEAKQEQMQREFPDSRLTFILCDVRDLRKLANAVDGATIIVHAAALKRVSTGERQADEFTKTNVDGTANVIDAALLAGVPRTMFVSSDKAVQPFNAYGKSKALAESLIVQANIRGANRRVRFAAVRGGNVWGSRGSVIEVWLEQISAKKPITISDPTVTRFHLPMEAWCAFVWRSIVEMRGGEIFIPKLRAWKLGDLVSAFIRAHANEAGEPYPYSVIGALDGDKLHEMLIAPSEICRTL